MSNQIVVPRELITLAFVLDDYARTGDIISGLIPMFRPVLHRMESSVFNPHTFAKNVHDYYGLPMKPLVARFLAPKMADFGLLIRKEAGQEAGQKAGQFEINTEEVSVAPHAVDTHKVDELLDGFCQFVRERANTATVPLEDDSLKKEFLKRVKTEEILLSIDDWAKGKPNKKEPEMADIEREHMHLDRQAAHRIDFLTAIYIQHLMENTPKKFETLQRFVVGVLIAEVVFTLRERPNSAGLLQDMSIIIDMPLILDALNMHTSELCGYAKDLFEMARKNNVKICAFQHSLDEMSNAASMALRHMNAKHPSYGLLSEKIRQDKGACAEAQNLVRDPHAAAKRLGITVIDAKEYNTPEFHKFCSPKIEKKIVGILGQVVQGENIQGKFYDAESVATILRLRQGNNPRTMVDAKWFFVTRNSYRAYQADSYLRARNIVKPESISPILTDRTIGGYLWFSTGASADQIAKIATGKLIANCSAAAEPRSDIMSTVRSFISSDPERQARLTAIMADDRARNIFADKTAGVKLSDINHEWAVAIIDGTERTRIKEAIAQKDAAFAHEREGWESERRKMESTQARTEHQSKTLREDLGHERQKAARLEEDKAAAMRREESAKKQAEKSQQEKEAELKEQQRQTTARLRDILQQDAVKFYDARCANIAKLIGASFALLGVGGIFLLMSGFYPDMSKWFSAGGGVVGPLFWWAAAKTKLGKRVSFHLSRKKAIHAQILQRADELGLPQDRLAIKFNNDSIWVGFTVAD